MQSDVSLKYVVDGVDGSLDVDEEVFVNVLSLLVELQECSWQRVLKCQSRIW